jgi:predicted DNA repair protein MutK
MAVGLAALLDDVAALAKLAAASVDDVGAAAGRASAKAAGVVVDDAAVTPAYVQGLTADRELPIIRRIAVGSVRNKLLIILPVALLLSAVAPVLVEVILVLGGTYLCFEGAEKVRHKLGHHDDADELPAVVLGPDAEERTVKGAIRTDLILSAEIMVIALKEVIDEPLIARALILVIVAVLITACVYGVVAVIVKMDDVGLRLAQRDDPSSQRLGRVLVAGMPKLLTVLSVVGTAAMLWVGGHILIAGAHELGWHTPHDLVHHAEEWVADVPGIGGALAWSVNTLISAIVGFAVGSLTVEIVTRVERARRKRASASTAPRAGVVEEH